MQTLEQLLHKVNPDKEPQQQLDTLQLFDNLTDEQIRELVSNKFVKSTEAGIVIEYLGFPKLSGYLQELLYFLQDMNWSAAEHVSHLLTRVGQPLIPFLKRIFKDENDSLWHYWILCEIVQNWDIKMIELLQDDLLELVHKADREGASVEALKLLRRTMSNSDFDEQFDYLQEQYHGDNLWLDELKQLYGDTKASR